jgi:hypothetical protein
MARFEATISSEVLATLPKPAHMGTTLLQNSGYIFGGAKEEDMERDEQVGIYNIGTLVGFITYKRNSDGSADVIISDVPNEQGDILTEAARQAVKVR